MSPPIADGQYKIFNLGTKSVIGRNVAEDLSFNPKGIFTLDPNTGIDSDRQVSWMTLQCGIYKSHNVYSGPSKVPETERTNFRHLEPPSANVTGFCGLSCSTLIRPMPESGVLFLFRRWDVTAICTALCL